MNIIILALEIIVIFATLTMFIGEKEDKEHWWYWNGAIIGTVLIMIALNFGTSCRGLSMCFSCGAGEPKDASSSKLEKEAKKAVEKLRYVKAGQTPPKAGGGFFSFGDDTPDVDLKNFSDPDEAAMFFDLTPGEIIKVANDESRKIVRTRNAAEQDERRAQIAKNLQVAKEQKYLGDAKRPDIRNAEKDPEYTGKQAPARAYGGGPENDPEYTGKQRAAVPAAEGRN